MPKKTITSRESQAIEQEMLAMLGECIEELCLRYAVNESDNSKSKSTRKDEAAELLKLVQLLEKYMDLRDRIMPTQTSENLDIDYTLIKNYLEKKGAGHADEPAV